jgi:hypothetical protein
MVTEEPPEAAIEVARLTHAVPEQERTKRARQDTIRQLVAAGVVLIVSGLGAWKLSDGALAGVLVAGITVLGGWGIVKALKSPPER